MRLGELGPDVAGYGRRIVASDAEHQASFLRQLPHGGERKAARHARLRLLDAFQQFDLHVGMQFAGRRHDAVEGLDAAARKYEFAGHEFVAGMAAAEQNLRLCARAVDQHQCRGVARLAVGRGLVALRIGHALGPEFGHVLGQRVFRHRVVRCLCRWRFGFPPLPPLPR
jgi:hypothetical protein